MMAHSIAHARHGAGPVDRTTPARIALTCALAAAFRIIARRTRADGIAGHVSCRGPGTDNQAEAAR